jgi:hypothetical protein
MRERAARAAERREWAQRGDSDLRGVSSGRLRQLVGRGTKERTPTRMVIILPGNFYLENYAVS